MRSTARLARRTLSTVSTKQTAPASIARFPGSRHSQVPSQPCSRSHFSTQRQLQVSESHIQYSVESATRHHPLPSKTYYSLFPQTLPEGPPPEGAFRIDIRALRAEFLKRQQSTHPDLFPPGERKVAETASAQLNKAYTTLLDPLLRAQYLLTLRGYTDPADDETSKLDDHDLIMEVLESNEILEEAQSEEDLEPLRQKNTQRVEESIKLLEEQFDNDELDKARVEAMRLRYWKNVEESLRHWEPGKPVVLQH